MGQNENSMHTRTFNPKPPLRGKKSVRERFLIVHFCNIVDNIRETTEERPSRKKYCVLLPVQEWLVGSIGYVYCIICNCIVPIVLVRARRLRFDMVSCPFVRSFHLFIHGLRAGNTHRHPALDNNSNSDIEYGRWCERPFTLCSIPHSHNIVPILKGFSPRYRDKILNRGENVCRINSDRRFFLV